MPPSGFPRRHVAARTKVPTGAVRIDGRGKYLMPGLVDMHVHFQPGPGNPDDPAGQQLALLVANGITTARRLGGPPGYLAVRQRAAGGEVLAPTLFVAGPSLPVRR